jgi:hypothetical protein
MPTLAPLVLDTTTSTHRTPTVTDKIQADSLLSATPDNLLTAAASDGAIYLNPSLLPNNDFWGSGVGTTPPNGAADTTASISRTGKVGLGNLADATYQLTITAPDALLLSNAATLAAKTSTGTVENWIQPRGSDNITYVNYGSAGLSLRTNALAQRAFVNTAGDWLIGNAGSVTAKFNVVHTAANALTLENGTTGMAANAEQVALDLRGRWSTATATVVSQAKIKAVKVAADGTAGSKLVFGTANASNAVTDYLAILPTGQITLNAYSTPSSFAARPNWLLGPDSSGNIVALANHTISATSAIATAQAGTTVSFGELSFRYSGVAAPLGNLEVRSASGATVSFTWTAIESSQATSIATGSALTPLIAPINTGAYIILDAGGLDNMQVHTYRLVTATNIYTVVMTNYNNTNIHLTVTKLF